MHDFKYISLAHSLNTTNHTKLLKNQLHYRGNLKSLSLISLSKETPELGVSNIKTEATALKKLELLIDGKIPLELGRSTREKELQSWLILNALKNKNRLFFDTNLTFISSELALFNEKNRVVNDILAIDSNNDLVIIELKSTREKKRIEIQVENFTNIALENKSFFTDYIKLITGKVWSGKTKGIAVWPDSRLSKRTISSKYREICYLESGVKGAKKIAYNENGDIQFKEIV